MPLSYHKNLYEKLMTAVSLDKELIKTRYVFIAMLIVQIVFFFCSLLIAKNDSANVNSSLDNTFRILIPLLGIVAMFLSNEIYNKRITAIPVDEKIEDKFNKYRSSKIIQWALIEGAGFLSLVSFIITQDYLYSIVFLFLIGYFYLLRPTKDQLKSDLKI